MTFPLNPSIGEEFAGLNWDGSNWVCNWPGLFLPLTGGTLVGDLLISNGGNFAIDTGTADFGGPVNMENLYIVDSASVQNTLYVNSLWVYEGITPAGTGMLLDNGYLVATGGVMSAPIGAAHSFGFWQGPGTDVMAFGFGSPTGTPTTDLMNLDISGNLAINGDLTVGGVIHGTVSATAAPLVEAHNELVDLRRRVERLERRR